MKVSCLRYFHRNCKIPHLGVFQYGKDQNSAKLTPCREPRHQVIKRAKELLSPDARKPGLDANFCWGIGGGYPAGRNQLGIPTTNPKHRPKLLLKKTTADCGVL